MGAPFFDVNSILELRKEKSRDAARSRRGKENYEFYELAKLLPLPAAITSQLDKASIIRLTISYLKLRDFSCHGEPQWTQEGGLAVNKISKGHQSRLDIIDPFESRQGTHILQSLDGFAFILANDGRFLYISETVSIYLGLSQVEMAGSSIFDYVHPQDHTELAEHLGMCVVPNNTGSPHGSGSDDGSSPTTPRPGSPTEKGYIMVQGPDKNPHKSFSLRMKSTLTKRGVHVKTTGYRVVHVLGSLRPQSTLIGLPRNSTQNNNSNSNSSVTSSAITTSNGSSSNNGNSNNNNSSGAVGGGGSSNGSESPLMGLVGMAIALPPPTITELRLELDTFITRLSPEFKVIYCEPIVSELLDLTVEDITDRLLYDLCHAADLKNLRRSHTDLLNKGQALTEYYRLVNRHGGYVWIQTCATTLLNNKNSDDQSILAINYVVSGIESKNCVMDLWQATGDVNSAMSSTSNSACREEKLKELKASKASSTASSKSKAQSGQSFSGRRSSVNTNSVHSDDASKQESKSAPSTLSPKNTLDNTSEEADGLSPEKINGGLDSKNKRRKMENPRKRKRSSGDPEVDPSEKALNLTRGGVSTSVITDAPPKTSQGDGQGVTSAAGNNRVPASILSTDDVTSSSPEDLSMKRTLRKSPDRHIIQHSSNVYRGATPTESNRLKSALASATSTGAILLDGNENNSSSPISMTGSSVKELEAAMNRHLPASSSSNSFTQSDKNSFDMLPDPSGISKGFPGLSNTGMISNSSSSSSSWLPSSRVSGPDMLTASNFLRSLYANRESVIKTSARSQPPFMNQEPPTSLLTPPEPDPTTYRDPANPYPYGKPDAIGHSHIYDKDMATESRDHFYKDQNHRDQYPFIPYKDHIPTAYIDHISSSVYKDHLASTYKDLSPYKDIIPAFTIPSLMSPTGRMHQAYPSFHPHFTVPITTATMDACSITPPSSNSPDVHKQASTHQFDPANYSTDLTNACNLSQKQGMSNPLSVSSSPTPNHHYHPNRHHKDQVYQAVNGGDVTKGGYYGVSAPSGSSMYMDLNQSSSNTGPYEACTRPVLPWY